MEAGAGGGAGLQAPPGRDAFLPTWKELGWPGGGHRSLAPWRAGACARRRICPSAEGGAYRCNAGLVRGCLGCETPGTSPGDLRELVGLRPQASLGERVRRSGQGRVEKVLAGVRLAGRRLPRYRFAERAAFPDHN